MVIKPWHGPCYLIGAGKFLPGLRHNAAGDHIPLGGVVRFRDMCEARATMLKLRSIGIRDYSVLEGRQRIGRIRFAAERSPSIWIWNVTIHLTGGLPMGSAKRTSSGPVAMSQRCQQATFELRPPTEATVLPDA